MEALATDLDALNVFIERSLSDKKRRPHLIREIARRLDVDFDLTLQHDRCLGLLALLGITQAPADDDLDELTGYLCAASCKIVRADIHYRYLEAFEALEESSVEAERLPKLIEQNKDNEAAPFAAYALSRWLDAKAKIDYRCGEYTMARLGFETAIEMASKAGHFSALPDFQSNFFRAQFEEHRTKATDPKELAFTYEKLKKDTLEKASSEGIPGPSEWTNNLKSLAPEHREFLRGLSSILHNYALALESAAHIDRSLDESILSANICRGLGDEYRLAQTLLHQGRILCEKKGLLDEAEERFEELSRSAWGRGKRIARQWRAYLVGMKKDIGRAAAEFQMLFDDFKLDRKRRGADVGADIAFQAFTVERFEKVLNQPEATRHVGYSTLIKRARLEKLRVARSLRRVVKVATYKRDYSKHVEPHYLNEIALELRSAENIADEALRQKWDDSILLLVEEMTGRELLDMLAANANELNDSFEEVVSAAMMESPASPVEIDLRAPMETAIGSPCEVDRRARRSARRNAEFSGDEVKAIEERRIAYERAALNTPVASTPINSEIAHELRIFTAADERRVVVRFFYEGSGNCQQLRAYVFRDGRGFLSQPLTGIARVRKLVEAWHRTRAPSAELAQAMFSELLHPLWTYIAPIGLDTRLTLIPSGELLGLPLHVALGEETNMRPLAAAVQLCFSVSAAAHMDRGRHMRGRFPIAADDHLFAFMKLDEDSSGRELVGLHWPASHLLICGDAPKGLSARAYTPVDMRGLEALIQLADVRPEFLLYSGHGQFDDKHPELGPTLAFGDLALTQFDVAQKVQLPRNKLTLLAACVTGQGGHLGGGEVGGFLRAFMAAGSGAIGLTLWDVLDGEMVPRVRGLFRGIHEKKVNGVFDVVDELRRLYAEACDAYEQTEDRLEACPFALYL